MKQLQQSLLEEISRRQSLEQELSREVDLRIEAKFKRDNFWLRNEIIEAFSTRPQLNKRDLEDREDSLH